MLLDPFQTVAGLPRWYDHKLRTFVILTVSGPAWVKGLQDEGEEGL